MEAVAAITGSILSVCLESLLGSLTSMDFLKYVDQRQVVDQLKKWEKMLRRIYAVLDDAEEKQTTNRLVEMWLSDLKDLAYDLEDAVDELATHVQQRKVRTRKGRRIIISSIPTSLNLRTAKFDMEMVSRVKEITARLDELVKQKDDLNLGESKTRRVGQASERPPSTSLVNEGSVYGREEDKKAILHLLKSEAGDVDIAVIPITGMGGVGKTTLAQLVYNHPSLEFDLKAWVCVSEDFDVFRITETILQSVDGQDYTYKSLNSLQEKLERKLLGKKFLIVLDDVWSENYEQWTLLRCPLEGGAVGSRIIITTRSKEVSLMTGSGPAYHLKELPYDECLSVFAQHALGATNFNQNLELEEIGKDIVKRCKGLPLAAKALGGLLRGKKNVNAWKEVLNSEIWDLPDTKANVIPALRLSYLYLPPHLKRCFAYCAIFPKDYEFDRDELVVLWKAEGFLPHPKDKKQIEGLGHAYFDDLLSRSFFQQLNDNRSRYVMHDLINDLARFVSRGTCFHLIDKELEGANSYANIRHSSFVPHKFNIFQRFKCFKEMKKLRTFLSVPQSDFTAKHLSRKVLQDLVPKLKCLRVLSLTHYWSMELPDSFGGLKHLRYLDLSHSRVQRLPKSVGKLLNLETLKLQGCKELIELPASICNLINLQYLDIRDTYRLIKLPPRIGNLTNLRVLSKFIVGEGKKGPRLSELKKFSGLEGNLQITGLQNVVDARDADSLNLKEKPGLLELELEWIDDTVDDSFNSEREVQVLKSLEPHPNLLRLSIGYFGGREFSSWIRDCMFSNMVELKLVDCRNITSLPPLGRLPALKDLRIEGMDGVKEVGSDFYEDDSCFPCLENLIIGNMEQWGQWSWSNGLNEDSVGKFRKLRKLEIKTCPKLVGKLPRFLPSLEELFIWNCPELAESPKELPSLVKLSIYGCQDTVLRNLSRVPCLTQLKIASISGLVRLEKRHIQALAALRNFEVRDCDELVCLWADGTNLDHLTCLKSLCIKSCKQLVSLVDGNEGLLPCNLESLNIEYCRNLKELTNGLYSLKSLKDLTVNSCYELVSLPVRGLPHSLKQLEIRGCPSLNQVLYSSEMSHLEKWEVISSSVSCSPNGKFPDSLKILSIGKGTKQVMESLYYGFSHLTGLEMIYCDELEMFPERELHIPNLRYLKIWSCKRLKSLSDHVQSFQCLESLEIGHCDEFEGLTERGLPKPSLPHQLPPKLTLLESRDCKNLSQPMTEWGLHRLTSLEKLTIHGRIRSTDEMVSFPDDGGILLPTSLTHLSISGFENLESISRGILNLTSLRYLEFRACFKLKSFPDEGLPPTLEQLIISKGCESLQHRCLKDKGVYWPIISHIPFIFRYTFDLF